MKIEPKKLTAFFLSSAVLAGCIFLLSQIPEESNRNSTEPVISQKQASEKKTESSENNKKTEDFTCAVWIPYMSLDLAGTDRSENSARERLSEIFDTVQAKGADTVFLHVRPFCDATYDSSIFPVSHILSGEQGKEVNYDFLKMACDMAKEKGIHLHAWINPLRVSLDKVPDKLSEDNPYIKWKNDNDSTNDRYTFQSGKHIYLNPAYPQVRKLIADGVREIVRNYDVDGIVIDDYFYPENDMKCDEYEYNLYSRSAGETYLSQKNWRKENINTLISTLYSAVHYEKKNCVFGISPQCNVENNEKIGADVKTWGSTSGYADYISPQIYVSENHPVLPFDKSADEWRKIVCNPDIRLYISLALYKENTDADNGTWLLKDDNISSQIEYVKKIGANGYVLYSYEDLKSE